MARRSNYMRRSAELRPLTGTWLLLPLAVMMLLPVLGCQDSRLALKQQNENLSKQLVDGQSQYRQLALEHQVLRQKNQELMVYLADQGSQLDASSTDLTGTSSKLKQANDQLKQTKNALAEKEKKIASLEASMSRISGDVSIKPNNSLYGALPVFKTQGVVARRDGDAISISLTDNNGYFTDQDGLTPSGKSAVREIADKLAAQYPNQLFAIEGRVKPAIALLSANPSNNAHERSVSLATAVFDEFTGDGQGKLQRRQVSITGWGSTNFVSSPGRTKQVDIIIRPQRAN